jgi:hypothetical protein
MANWVKYPGTKKRTVADDQRDDLTVRLAAARTRLDEVDAAKRHCALVAATGDDKARREFLALDDEAADRRTEIEIVELAIETIKQQKTDQQRQQQEQRAAEAAKRRKAILDLREAEARENIERTIRRFEGQGNRAQVEVWRFELSRLRERLEAEIS